ncbi:MAG: gamma-glutamylcyclotransferase family protein [Promethearchaeota archaeon]
MSKEVNSSARFYNVVGYGTFITKKYYEDKQNVEVCLIQDFIRIFPQGNWFPYALSLRGSSFWALKFSVSLDFLKKLDYYEGVSSGLFNRIEISILLKNEKKKRAFLYIPSQETIEKYKLSPELDSNDRWKEEIRKFPEITKKFPKLVQ